MDVEGSSCATNYGLAFFLPYTGRKGFHGQVLLDSIYILVKLGKCRDINSIQPFSPHGKPGERGKRKCIK